MKRRVTYLAVIRGILAAERHSRAQAAKVAKSRAKWERELAPAYKADADEYGKLAELVRGRKWEEAFRFWEELDTFVREGVPSAHMTWILGRLRNG